MPKIIRWALLLCALPAAAGAADLLAVYGLAIEHDTRLRAAHHAREAVLQNRPLARAALLPRIDGSATYALQRNKITQEQDGGGEMTRITTSEPYDYGLNLSQAVFDAGAFLRLRQAGDEAAVAEAEYRAEEQALILRTALAYFTVLAAEDNLRFARAESDATDRQHQQAEGRFRAGIAAYTDVQETQAQYDLTLAAILAAERFLRSSRQALAEIIAQADLPLAPLRDEIPLPTPQPDDARTWVTTALESNFDLISARLRTEISEREINVQRAGHAPTLQLEAAQRFGESAGFNRGDFETSVIGLTLQVPIFNGLATWASVQQSLSVHEQRRAELTGTERTVERVVRDAFDGVTSGAGQVRALLQAVASNQTALEASEAGLRVGTRTIVDVLTTQRVLFQAERDYTRARYDYLLSVLLLKQASGRLLPADLVEINGVLAADPELAAGRSPVAATPAPSDGG